MPTPWRNGPTEPERQPESGEPAATSSQGGVPAGRDGAANGRADAAVLHAFVLEIGRALSLAGTAVNETQDRLVQIAAANGARMRASSSYPQRSSLPSDRTGGQPSK